MKKIVIGAVIFALALAVVAVSQTPAGPKHHVVFQMTEEKGRAWEVLNPHVMSVRSALAKEGVEVEVVFYGPGLEMLLKKNTEFEERLKQLSDAGVKLAACQNAMRARKVTTEDLFPFVSQVDSGIAELTRKQEAGWAYIH